MNKTLYTKQEDNIKESILGQSQKKMAKKRDIGPHYFFAYPNMHSCLTIWSRSSAGLGIMKKYSLIGSF